MSRRSSHKFGGAMNHRPVFCVLAKNWIRKVIHTKMVERSVEVRRKVDGNSKVRPIVVKSPELDRHCHCTSCTGTVKPDRVDLEKTNKHHAIALFFSVDAMMDNV